MHTNNLNQFYTPSVDPAAAIEKVAYPGQAPYMKTFRPGYGFYFGALPVLTPHDPLLKEKTAYSLSVLNALGQCLIDSGLWFPQPMEGRFERTIIGIEDPVVERDIFYADGAEIIVAHWGKGFVSPVHGHVAGLHYEEILVGKFRAHSYRAVDEDRRIARPALTEIVKRGPFVGVYEDPDPIAPHERRLMIHNFEALVPTHSLHFLGEHSRDGQDNGYLIEYFEDVHHLSVNNVRPISTTDALYLPIGSVVLVRSSNVPDYGDHYIIITGRPVLKEHGLRPKDHPIQAPHASAVLDRFHNADDVTLLLLDRPTTKTFHSFHGTETFVHMDSELSY